MIGFYDDEHQPHALPEWATLTEVSKAVGITREIVRAAARQALKHEELWVKKKQGRFLINTTAASYKEHVRQWTALHQHHLSQWQKSRQEVSLPESALDPFAAAEEEWRSRRPGHPGKAPVPSHPSASLVLEGHRQWPALCSWLSSQGLSVFFNLLAGEQEISLQWQWGELRSEYYSTDIKDAVIDALDCKLKTKPSVPSVPLPSAPAPKKRSLRFWRFVKEWRWHTR